MDRSVSRFEVAIAMACMFAVVALLSFVSFKIMKQTAALIYQMFF